MPAMPSHLARFARTEDVAAVFVVTLLICRRRFDSFAAHQPPLWFLAEAVRRRRREATPRSLARTWSMARVFVCVLRYGRATRRPYTSIQSTRDDAGVLPPGASSVQPISSTWLRSGFATHGPSTMVLMSIRRQRIPAIENSLS